MTQEEKAKAYDSIFERLKEMYNNNKINVAAKLVYERYFPELKESEDERMIQYFKDLAPFDKADELYEKYGFSHKDALAWLEKQCRHAKFINGIQVGDKVTRNEDGVLVNLSQLKRVAKKQGEQKPADTEKGTNGNNREIPNSEPLLTIKHAKEVMGIKQDDAWSEKDEKMFDYALNMIDWYGCVDKDKSKPVSDWLKSLKDRYTWKPSDEQMYNLSEAAHYRTGFWDCDILIGLYDELKKVREEKL